MSYNVVLVFCCREHAPSTQAGCMCGLCTCTHPVTHTGRVSQLWAAKVLGKHCLTMSRLCSYCRLLHLQQAAVHVHQCKPAV